MANLDVRPSAGPIGGEILGIDLSKPLSDESIAEIEAVLYHHGVIAFRDQSLTPEGFVAVSRRFGTPQVNVRSEILSPKLPEIILITNLTADGKPVGSHDYGRYWHSDLCYLDRPSKLTLLYAAEGPAADGPGNDETHFASAADAYDALPDAVKEHLDGLKAANSYRYMWNKKAKAFGVRPVLSEEDLNKFPPDAIHPVVRTHPVTGRKCLYVCEGYTRQILGVPEAESATLLQELLAHVVKPEFVHQHQWRLGDVLIWDNCAVQHRATFDETAPPRRYMQRCTIEGSVPF